MLPVSCCGHAGSCSPRSNRFSSIHQRWRLQTSHQQEKPQKRSAPKLSDRPFLGIYQRTILLGENIPLLLVLVSGSTNRRRLQRRWRSVNYGFMNFGKQAEPPRLHDTHTLKGESEREEGGVESLRRRINTFLLLFLIPGYNRKQMLCFRRSRALRLVQSQEVPGRRRFQ